MDANVTSDQENKNPVSISTTGQQSAKSGDPAAPTPQEQSEILEVVQQIATHPGELTTEVIHVQTSVSGPLPPPENFEKYNQSLPGAADRIMTMAEKEQQIRAAGQEKILSNDSKRINVAAFLGLSVIVVAGIAAWNGNASIAVPLGVIGAVAAIIRQLLGWLKSRNQ